MTSKATQFLSADQIDNALREAKTLFADQHVALCGGLAMQLYGSDRMTKDVDVVAEQLPEDVKVKRPLTFGGAVIETRSGTLLAVIVRSDAYANLYDHALSTALRRKGIPIPVVTAEALAAMKLVAARKKDEDDLLFLLTSRAVKLPRARALIREHLGVFAVDEFNRRVDEAAWLRSRR